MVLYGKYVTWWRGIPLYFSNVLILPAVVYAFYIGAYLEASLYTSVAFVSTVYHLCDTSVTCFGLKHMVFELVDHILAQTAVTWTLIYFLAFDHPRYRGVHLAEKDMFRVFSLVIHMILALLDHTNSFMYVYVGVMQLFILAYKVVVVDNFRWRGSDYRVGYLVGAALLVGGGLSAFLISKSMEDYWWTHTIWHSVVFLGLLLVLMSRRHGSFEDKLYVTEAAEPLEKQRTQRISSLFSSFRNYFRRSLTTETLKKHVSFADADANANDNDSVSAYSYSSSDDGGSDSASDLSDGDASEAGFDSDIEIGKRKPTQSVVPKARRSDIRGSKRV